MSDYATVTVGALYRAIPEPTPSSIEVRGTPFETRDYHTPPGVDIRLRPATIAFFPLSDITKIPKGRYMIGMRKSKRMPQGGVYGGVLGEALIDVKGLDFPDYELVPVRGPWDLYLHDLDEPYDAPKWSRA